MQLFTGWKSWFSFLKSDLMRWLTSDSIGSIAARKLIPAAIAMPLVLGWLILQGQQAGWYDSSFGLSLLSMSLAIVSLGLIGRNAVILHRVESERKSSEERLQLALQGAEQGIWDWDLKTRVLTWDDRCKEIFGVLADFPVTYEWHLDALHPDDRQRVFDAAAIALRDRREFDEEYRTFHPDGTMRWVLARGRGYYNTAGEPYRMSGTVMDVSDRQITAAALVETNNLLQGVINSTNDVIFIKDLQGRYVLANQAAARWLNTTVEAMLGQDDMVLFPAEAAQSIQAVDRQVMQSGEFVTYEEQLLKYDDLRSLLSTKYPWRNDRGEIIGMIGISLDVTDLKQAEVAWRESEQRYRFLVENTSDMVFHVRLRQPLPLDLPVEPAVDWIFREAFLVAVNDGFLRAYSYDRADELVGKPLIDLFPRTPENEAMERALVANRHRIVEARTEEVDRHGRRKVMLNSIVGRSEGGYVYDYIGTARDITERVLAEEALAAQEQRYRYIFASVGVSIWEEDFSQVKTAIDQLKASGIQDFRQYFAEHPEFVQWAIGAIRILDVNEVTLQMAGAQDKARLLTSLHEICLPETIQAFIEEFLTIAAGETFFQSETVVKTLQGEQLYVLFTITFPPPAESYDRVLVTWVDISDRKRRELNEQFLSELDWRLRQLSDAEAMAWETVSSLGEYLRVDRCLWHEIDWENRSTTVERNWRREDVPDVTGTYALEEYFTPNQLSDFAAGQALIVCDVTTHPSTAPSAQKYLPLGAAAFVSIPCIHSGCWVAVLAVNAKTVRNWRSDEVLLLQETVARLWSIVEQTRAVQALKEQEEQTRLATEAAKLGMWFWDLGNDELVWTDRCKALFGLAPKTQMTYEVFLNALHPDDRDRTHAAVTRALDEKVEYEIEYRTVWSDGSIHWILAKGRGFYNANGQPLRMMGTTQDISDRKIAEADLQERSEHIQLLYEITRDLLSTEQPLTLVDTLFAKLKPLVGLDVYFNYLLDEQRQQLHLMFYGGISNHTAKDIEWLEMGQAVCGTVAQQRCQIVQSNLQHSTDSKTQLVRSLGLTAYSCQPLIAQGKLFGTLGFGSRTRTDFTPAQTTLFQAICDRIAIALERSELVSSLQQQTEELMQANRLKDEFLAALSHELRTPLNPILGWTKMLQGQKLAPAKTAQALETIERNVRQQIALVDDLLDVSRVIQGKLKLEFAPVDLALTLNRAIETMHFAAVAKAITIDLHSLSSLQTRGDGDRLQQIFWNLLSNAIKFTPEGGRVDVELSIVNGSSFIVHRSLPLTINHQPSTINSYAQIRITDTGIGIAPEFLPHVFDHFRQADGSTTRKYGGLGLGLAIVRHLVELHGGTVGVVSPGIGQGSTFTIALPLLTEGSALTSVLSTAPISDSHRNNPPQSKPIATASKATIPLAGKRILLVDDQPDNLDVLSFLLEQDGAKVTAVTSSEKALAIATENPPDLIISDIGMPQMDGYELIRRVKALPQGREIPAIALTGFARREDQEEAISAGFQAYIPKPVDPLQLLSTLTQLLQALN